LEAANIARYKIKNISKEKKEHDSKRHENVVENGLLNNSRVRAGYDK